MKPNAAPLNFKDSTLQGGLMPADAGSVSPLVPRASMFDACHVGVVLRVVLFVQIGVGVGAMFGTAGPLDWLLQFSWLTGGALPATLVWLIAICAFKRGLSRLAASWQWLLGTLLGAVAGLYGCGLLALMGLLQPAAQWGASAAGGALLSALVLQGLFWRAKARTPAATAARLAELFRSALADPAESVTLGQEIALAQRYLDIEQIRFGDRLRVQWSLDASADAARLPPLLLQPLVENAVRHGVEPSASGAELKISTLRRGSTVVIKVTNSAPAGAGQPGHGLALANVRERLFLLHDVQAQFKTAFKDGLFQVRLEIPL